VLLLLLLCGVQSRAEQSRGGERLCGSPSESARLGFGRPPNTDAEGKRKGKQRGDNAEGTRGREEDGRLTPGQGVTKGTVVRLKGARVLRVHARYPNRRMLDSQPSVCLFPGLRSAPEHPNRDRSFVSSALPSPVCLCPLFLCFRSPLCPPSVSPIHSPIVERKER